MRVEFGYSQQELDRIELSVSRERLGPYLSLVGGDLRRAIWLYDRNTSLSEVLWGLLQGLEVTLRNAMHRTLSDGIGRTDWYDSIPWKLAQQQQIASAKDSLSKKGKPITPGRMVAELTFGFWVGLTGPKYSVALWERHLYKAFRNAKLGRKQLNKRLETIRLLRNRVAHHEPILSRDLQKDFDSILETIGWIDRDTERWIRYTSCFQERLNANPRMTEP